MEALRSVPRGETRTSHYHVPLHNNYSYNFDLFSYSFPVGCGAVRAIGTDQAQVAVAARRPQARAAAATPRRRPFSRDAPRPPELARLRGTGRDGVRASAA